MTKGISPLEMSGAFGTIANGGTRVDSITYTKVEDKHGELVLETDPQSTEVLDEGVAFVTQDILRTTVTNGIAANAQVSGQTTAGKTGTTSDSMDIWFCGFTPQYSAALWIGNDVNITIDATSDAVASLWSTIMTKATSGMDGSLKSQPDNVKKIDGEYYVTGTEAGRTFDASMDEEKKKKEEEEKKKKEEEEKKKAEEEAKKEQEQIAVIQVKLLTAEIQVIPVPTADRLLLSRLYQGKNCTNTCLNLYQLNSRHNKADTNMVSADFLGL